MGMSQPVLTLYDRPMWDSMERQRLELQSCEACDRFRYPPSPTCPHCLSMESRWQAVSGRGTILSWVVFHRRYFDDHPAPYNVVAVKIAEGPIIVSTLVGEEPQASWIGAEVELVYRPHRGRMQHAVRLSRSGPPEPASGDANA